MAKPNWLHDLSEVHGLSVTHADLRRMWDTFRERTKRTWLFEVNEDVAIQQAFIQWIVADVLGVKPNNETIRQAVTDAMPTLIAEFRKVDAQQKERQRLALLKMEEDSRQRRAEQEANIRCNALYCVKRSQDDLVIEDGKAYHKECAPSYRQAERQREEERRYGKAVMSARHYAALAEQRLEARRAEMARITGIRRKEHGDAENL